MSSSLRVPILILHGAGDTSAERRARLPDRHRKHAASKKRCASQGERGGGGVLRECRTPTASSPSQNSSTTPVAPGALAFLARVKSRARNTLIEPVVVGVRLDSRCDPCRPAHGSAILAEPTLRTVSERGVAGTTVSRSAAEDQRGCLRAHCPLGRREGDAGSNSRTGRSG